MAQYTHAAETSSLHASRCSTKSRPSRKAQHPISVTLSPESPGENRYARCLQPASPSQVSKSASRASLHSSRESTHTAGKFASESTTSSDSECGFSTPEAKSPRHSISQQTLSRPSVTMTLQSSNSLAAINTAGKTDIRSVVQQVDRPSENAHREHMFSTFQALKFVQTLQPADQAQIAQKMVWLPPTHRKTVVFDLDETLVHCIGDCSKAHATVQVPMPTGETMSVGINIRPFARECLEAVGRFCEVIVFTASQQVYADRVLDLLDPTHSLVHHRLYRDHCVIAEGIFIKDLRVLGNRRLKDITIVDNAAYSFAYQLENGVPIISWYEDLADRELYNLASYLQRIRALDDVRTAHRDTFRLHRFYEDYLREFIRPA